MNGDSIFEKVKSAARIAEVVERFGVKLDRAGKACCPFHNEDTPSFSVKKEDNIFKCFGCGESGDAIHFVAKIKNIEPLEAAKTLAEMYGIDADNRPHSGGKQRGDKIPAPVKKTDHKANCGGVRAIKEYIMSCIATVSRTDYFSRRGLSEDTIRKFCLGFDEKKQAVVIPYSSKLEYYQTRSVIDKQFRKPSTEEAGAEPLYNFDAISKAKNGAVFVVESPICALSIMQCGGLAVSTCGVGGASKIIAEVKRKKPDCIFVLCFDNDDAGRKAQQDLANELYELNAKFITYNVAGEKKDPNDLLMANPSALSANVKAAVAAAKQQFSKLKKLFSASELQQKRIRPIRWIVRELLPEGVTIVCAPSKFGKSWMMMQLCTAIAEGKNFLNYETVQCDCVYFSLEDSERRFQSRLNTTLSGKAAPPNFYGSVECSSMANGLFGELEELMESHPKIGLIVIDTFQRVRQGQGKNESAYASDYREIGEFKIFAEKYGIGILLVHHLRKQIDEADIFNMINGSMGLMGASDTTWILARKKRTDENTSFVATGRDISDINLILFLDKTVFHWEVIGSAEDQTRLEAKKEYEGNPVIKTIKALVAKYPQGWRGNCTEIKLKIYEETGELYTKSVESIGRVINGYGDRLLADGITHREERGKKHYFANKRATLFQYSERDDE